jgi:sugar O-acyltransferase (sialic acid O-acetyltransferase NeuD family)
MNLRKESYKNLSIIGYCHDNTPIVVELAHEAIRVTTFDIIKNIEVDTDGLSHAWDKFKFNIYAADEYQYQKDNLKYYFGVLDAHIKYILFHLFSNKYGTTKDQFFNLVHPSAYVSMSSKNERAFLLEPLSVVSAFSKIGFGVSVKRGSTIGHHTRIEDFVSINPGVNISGNVHIGEGATIGTGASVIHNLTIGKHSLIGAGSVVTKDIPEGVIPYGNPCKVVRTNKRWEKAFERLEQMKKNRKSIN